MDYLPTKIQVAKVVDTLGIPLSKSVWEQGRIGPASWQDGYRVQMEGVSMIKSGEVTRLLLMSGMAPNTISRESELVNMVKIVCKYGNLKENYFITLQEGRDTYEQVGIAFGQAKTRKMDLLFISTLLHHPRVRWIVWRRSKQYPDIKYAHKMVIGIPRPSEAITDIILIFAYPIICMIPWLRNWFHKETQEIRKEGSLFKIRWIRWLRWFR